MYVYIYIFLVWSWPIALSPLQQKQRWHFHTPIVEDFVCAWFESKVAIEQFEHARCNAEMHGKKCSCINAATIYDSTYLWLDFIISMGYGQGIDTHTHIYIYPNAPKYFLRECLEAKAPLLQNEAQTLSEGKLNLTRFMLDAYFEILKDI